jgi:RNA polymerase sigma factor (sigma-70 family)
MIDRDELITAHMGLADRIAARKKRQVPPTVQYEELQSAAYMGLVEAATKYQKDFETGASFETYAYQRIDGAVKDYLRERRWGGRTHHREVASLDARSPDGGLLADTVADHRTGHGGEGDVFERAAAPLGGTARDAMKLYYVGGLTMKEVGNRLGVTESRVSQIVARGRAELREAWACREHELWSEVA